MASAAALHAVGRGFESLSAHTIDKKSKISILNIVIGRGSSVVEHIAENDGVASSILAHGTQITYCGRRIVAIMQPCHG